MNNFKIPLHARLFYSIRNIHFPTFRLIYFFLKRRYEKSELSFLRERVTPEMVVMDIGANIGFYTNFLSELVGSEGQVHAFEPDPFNFSRLQETTGPLKNVQRHQVAIGPEDGRMSLFLSSSANIDSYLTESSGANTQTVAVRSMDSFCRNMEHVDGIKMDIQGGEYGALKGMQKTIERNRHMWILFEFWPFGLVRSGSRPEAVLDLLEKYGFNCSLLDGSPARRFPIEPDNWKSFVDVFAEPKQ